MTIYVLSAMAGGGKGFLLNETCKEFPNLKRVPLLRTRPIRYNERNTNSTPFCTNSEFEKMVKKGEILVQEQFPTDGVDYYYGIRKKDIPNTDCILELSPTGIEQLRKHFDNVVVIYIYASPIVRKDRYIKRGGVYTEMAFDEREERDMEQFNKLKYDYFVINNDIDKFGAMKNIKKIIGGK